MPCISWHGPYFILIFAFYAVFRFNIEYRHTHHKHTTELVSFSKWLTIAFCVAIIFKIYIMNVIANNCNKNKKQETHGHDKAITNALCCRYYGCIVHSPTHSLQTFRIIFGKWCYSSIFFVHLFILNKTAEFILQIENLHSNRFYKIYFNCLRISLLWTDNIQTGWFRSIYLMAQV